MNTAVEDDRQYHLLLVEDDPVNIDVIVSCIGNLYQLYIAKTREKAFKILAKTDIDLVLLDINLPDGNGFDICKELMDNKDIYGNLNVVFMTGMDKPEDEARGIQLGASDYITKPINCTVLKARIDLQTKLIRQTELLSQLARIDGITEINNRRAFDDQLKNEWNRAMREQKELSLCLLDLDFFKQYNDTYGHPAGDECLRKLAKCLKNKFRRGSDFVARYGGEEFAILFYRTDADEAKRLIEQVLDSFMALKIRHETSKVSDYTSFSAGICSTLPDEAKSPDVLLGYTDKQLYLAKEQGRAKVNATRY